MKYSKWEEIRRIRHNKSIWACAFEYDVEKQYFSLKQAPVLGVITDSGQFKPYKKGSRTLVKNGVSEYSRCYADTKEECKELYLELMDRKIKYLQSCIDMIEKEKTKVTK